MKQIVGLGYGTVVFTHGASEVGKLVFSGFVGFAPARLLAVTNVEKNTLIYAAEKEPRGDDPGKGGSWSLVTASGGTLTLNADTSTHEDDDLLRCIYDADMAAPVAPQAGGNLWPKDFGTCDLASGCTRTANFGVGPRPGTRSVQLYLSGDNDGANTGDIVIRGRTDGALVGLSVWVRAAIGVAFDISIREYGYYNIGWITTATRVVTTTEAGWALYRLTGYIIQTDCTALKARIRANAGGPCTIEVAEPDLRILDNFNFPPYEPPCGAAQTVTIGKRLGVSIAAWGDSMVTGYASFNWRDDLSRMLNGSPIYNGGVGGEASTTVKTRFTNSTRYFKSYGVQIFWIGTADIVALGSTNPDLIVSNLDDMILKTQHGRWLVVPLINYDGSMATTEYALKNEAYKKMKQRYGTRFVDALMPLRCGGLYVPDMLMHDTLHLNQAGCGIVTLEIFKAMKRNGFLDGVPLGDWGDSAEREQTHQITLQTSVAAIVANDTPILAAGKRHGFSIVNETTTGVLYLAYGLTASLTSYTYKLAPGDAHRSMGDQYHGPISGYWSVADGNARVTEVI